VGWRSTATSKAWRPMWCSTRRPRAHLGRRSLPAVDARPARRRRSPLKEMGSPPALARRIHHDVVRDQAAEADRAHARKRTLGALPRAPRELNSDVLDEREPAVRHDMPAPRRSQPGVVIMRLGLARRREVERYLCGCPALEEDLRCSARPGRGMAGAGVRPARCAGCGAGWRRRGAGLRAAPGCGRGARAGCGPARCAGMRAGAATPAVPRAARASDRRSAISIAAIHTGPDAPRPRPWCRADERIDHELPGRARRQISFSISSSASGRVRGLFGHAVTDHRTSMTSRGLAERLAPSDRACGRAAVLRDTAWIRAGYRSCGRCTGSDRIDIDPRVACADGGSTRATGPSRAEVRLVAVVPDEPANQRTAARCAP